MNYLGVIIGVFSFVIIGLFHPIVIKSEYHFGTGIWPLFLVVGLLCLGISLFITNVLLSAALGVFGCSALYSIHELYQQKKRVAKGWFPKKEKR